MSADDSLGNHSEAAQCIAAGHFAAAQACYRALLQDHPDDAAALAGLGALAGILIAPITFTSYEAGVMLGLKGFSAAIVGGIGNPMGAVAGGLLLGVLESLGAGFISSGYKDAIAFLFVLMVLFFEPTGLFGHKTAERV